MHTTDKYAPYLAGELMMGPSTLHLLEEMLRRHPLKKADWVLDLGCGTGLSSLFLARETGAKVLALDLWCSATDNLKRIRSWGMEGRILPIHADAKAYPVANDAFDAVISIDSYHYFACAPDYFTQRVLPLVKKGGQVLIVMPGLKAEFGETVPEAMWDWAGEEYKLFHSCTWWRETIGQHPDMDRVEVEELACFDEAWQAWFDSGHEYAQRDRAFFDKGIGQYLNFVGIAVTKKA